MEKMQKLSKLTLDQEALRYLTNQGERGAKVEQFILSPNMLKKLLATIVVLGLMSVTSVMMKASASTQETKQERRERNERHPHIRAAIHELAEARHELETAQDEKHPHVEAAVRELEEAKREVQTAAHDFGGHRVEALEAIDPAIQALHCWCCFCCDQDTRTRKFKCSICAGCSFGVKETTERIDSAVRQLRQALQYDKK